MITDQLLVPYVMIYGHDTVHFLNVFLHDVGNPEMSKVSNTVQLSTIIHINTIEWYIL